LGCGLKRVKSIQSLSYPQDLVQASVRGYLLDKQIEKLVVDNQALFPRYWLDAVDYA
jgi:hypothetical protein